MQEGTTEKHDSSDEIEIKEEPAVVVEISSEDEKPNIENLLGTFFISMPIFVLFITLKIIIYV